MTDNHRILITSMDMHTIDLEPYQYSGVNITGIRLVNPENPLMEHVTNFLNEPKKESAEQEGEGADDRKIDIDIPSRLNVKEFC